jgi:hypothetical protein
VGAGWVGDVDVRGRLKGLFIPRSRLLDIGLLDAMYFNNKLPETNMLECSVRVSR